MRPTGITVKRVYLSFKVKAVQIEMEPTSVNMSYLAMLVTRLLKRNFISWEETKKVILKLDGKHSTFLFFLL